MGNSLAINRSVSLLQYELFPNWKNSHDQLERYLAARSFIVSGNIPEAEETIATLPDILQRILRANLNAYIFKGLQTSFEDLKNIDSKEVSKIAPWLMGDLYLTLSFLSTNLSHYNIGLKYSQFSIDIFRKNNLPAFESLALFNAWVCANHGEHLEHLDLYRTRINHLAANFSDSTTIMIHKSRLDAYYALDSENFDCALDLFSKLINLSKIQNRKRDIESALSFLIFCSIKLQNWTIYHEHFPTDRETIYFPERFRVFEVISKWSYDKISSIDEVTLLIKDLDSVGKLLALYLTLDHITRTKNWNLLWKGYLLFCGLTKKCGQSLSILDARYYGALALFHLGLYEDASKITHSYEIDSRARHKDFRAVSKLKKLVADLLLEDHSHLEIFFNEAEETIKSKIGVISLKDKPLIKKSLLVLVENKANSTPTDSFFSMVYDCPYNQIRHASRLTSLIARTRDTLKPILGFDPIIVLDNTVQFSPRIIFSFTTTDKNLKENTNEILSNLIDLFHKQPEKKWTMQEICPFFQCSRRTLQTYLGELLDKQIIVREGERRGVRYLLEKRNNLTRDVS